MNNVEELIEEFQELDGMEATQLLDELGRELPEIPESVRVDEYLVPGCQSRVWLVAELEGAPESGAVRITADSDAIVVKGLIFVAKEIFDGRTPREILDADYQSVFDRMGVGRLITPQRKNGLNSVIRRIRTFAATSLGIDAEESRAGVPKPTAAVKPTLSITDARERFPILNQTLPNGSPVIYLDSGASAQKPDVVIAKEQEVEQQYFANAFRGTYYFGNKVDDGINAARESVRRLINARSTDEIVFTAGTTMSINLIAHGWARTNVKAGDEIVLSEMEHHANHVPWQMVAKASGATLKFLPMTDDYRLDESKFNEVITERCALVAISGMSNVLGTINPVKKLADRAHEVGAKILVDGAQTVPHQQVDVQAEDIDFLTFSGHKLYGPTGVGVLYGKREVLEEVAPLFGGGHMIESVNLHESTWAPLPARLEAGTMPIVQIIGLGAAIEFVESIGFDAIHEHETALLRYAHEKLAPIPGLTIYGPSVEHKGAIVSFTIDGVSAEDLSYQLDRRGVFTRHGHHCTMPLHRKLNVSATTRASFGMYNTKADVDALVDALQTPNA